MLLRVIGNDDSNATDRKNFFPNLSCEVFNCIFVFFFKEKCSPNHTPEANKNIALSGTSGTINSPLLLAHNLECRWTITVPSGHRIKLSFSFFHLGEIEAQADCEKVDHVKVQDGNDGNDPVLGTFCGYVAPSPLFSVGPKIEITFASNGDRVLQGFSARFESISGGKLKKNNFL